MAHSLINTDRTMKVWYKMRSWRLTIALVFGLTGTLYNIAFSQDSPPDMPHPRVGMCSARLGDKLYLIGGATQIMQSEFEDLVGTPVVDAFDFKSQTWDTTIAPLETPRVYATAVALDDSIYVMGGVDDSGKILKSVEVYDPIQNEWHPTSSMHFRRKGAASVVYGDSIFVFGGAGYLNILQNRVETYSPATGTWSIADTLLYARAFHQVVRIKRYVYVFGGLGLFGPYSYIERYDPANGSIKMGITWNEPRYAFAVINLADSVFAISGFGSSSSDGFYGDVELLNFQMTNANLLVSKLAVSLDSERAFFIADTGNYGKIYIFGGLSPEFKRAEVPVPSVEVVQLTAAAVNVVQDNSASPQDFSLSQNYPNPFNPTTTITFQVPSPGSMVRLEVFNVLGQKVATLEDEFEKGGKYSVVFSGENLPSGAYIYRLQNENGIAYRKMVLIK